MAGEKETKNTIKESIPEQSGRTSFATKVRETEENPEIRNELITLKSKRDDDIVFLVVSPRLLFLGLAFIFISINKIEGVINPLSFAFFVSMVCFALGLFFLLFGGIRLFIHRKRIKETKLRQ